VNAGALYPLNVKGIAREFPRVSEKAKFGLSSRNLAHY